MPVPPVHDADEPLSPFFDASEEDGELRSTRFEYSSGGDRVVGRVWQPTRAGAAPLVVLGHPHGAAHDAADVVAVARAWARAGAAVATFDLPLHGARASGKLGERAFRAVGAGEAADALDADLRLHVVQQTTLDVRRALALLRDAPGVDPARCAFAAFGIAAELAVAVGRDGDGVHRASAAELAEADALWGALAAALGL